MGATELRNRSTHKALLNRFANFLEFHSWCTYWNCFMETFFSHLRHILQTIISINMTKIKKKTSRYVKQSSFQPTSYKTHFLRASNETMIPKWSAEKAFFLKKKKKELLNTKRKLNMLTAHLAYSDTCCKSTHNVLSLVSQATYSAKNTWSTPVFVFPSVTIVYLFRKVFAASVHCKLVSFSFFFFFLLFLYQVGK